MKIPTPKHTTIHQFIYYFAIRVTLLDITPHKKTSPHETLKGQILLEPVPTMLWTPHSTSHVVVGGIFFSIIYTL